MKAQWAVSASAQTTITSSVVRRTSPRNRSRTRGWTPPAARRGRVPLLGLGDRPPDPEHQQPRAARRPGRSSAAAWTTMSAIRTLASTASRTPTLTPVCRTAAIQGRQRRGQVSDSSEAPTAHSPPMPSADRKRKISRCHQLVARHDSPVNSGVGEDGQRQRPAAPQAVADAAEEAAAQRPAEQEAGLDDRGVAPDAGIAGAEHAEQLGHELARTPACRGACPGRRRSSPARRRRRTATAAATDRRGVAPGPLPLPLPRSRAWRPGSRSAQ